MIEKVLDSVALVYSMVSIGLVRPDGTATTTSNNPDVYRNRFLDYYLVH